MEGIRFYLEHDSKRDKRKGKHNGNVFALYTDNAPWFSDGKPMYGGAGAVYFSANSPCCSTDASKEYLQDQCKRISEEEARKIHPELFNYLER